MTETKTEYRTESDKEHEQQSHKSLQVDFYDGLQPTTLTAELMSYHDGSARWSFRLHDRSTGSPKIILWCDLNELLSLILLGKAQRDSLLGQAQQTQEGER